MVLLAIDLFGIRPFAQPKRILLKPGLNTIVGPNGSGKTMACQTLSSLILNTPSNQIAWNENSTAQAALTFKSKDGLVYRIARDYQKKMWNLSKMDSTTNKFAAIESDRDKILDWLRNETGGLGEKERELLFLIDRFRLPSYISVSREDGKLPVPKMGSDGTGIAPDIGSAPVFSEKEKENVASDPKKESEKEKELKILEGKLEALEAQHDEMLRIQDQATSIQKRINQYNAIELQLKQMEESEAEKFSLISSEEPISPELLQSYEKEEKDKQSMLVEIDDEMEVIDVERAAMQDIQAQPFKDRLCLTGLAFIAISFLLPFVVTLSGLFRYLFLVGILGGSGISAFAYFRIMKKVAAKSKLKKNLSELKEKSQQIEKNFEADHKVVCSFMQKTGSKDLSELKGMQTAYVNLMKKKEAAQKEKDKFLEGQTIESLEAETKPLEEKAEALEDKLKGIEDISREVYRLQDEIRVEKSGSESPDAGLLSLPNTGPMSKESEDSFVSAILSIGKVGDPSAKRDRLQQSIGRLYELFQHGKSETIEVKENGEIFEGDTPLNHLSSGIADQIFLSLALSVLEQFPDVSFPIVLDDPFSTLDANAKEIAGKIVREISKQRQVILFTTEAFSPSENDHVFKLS